MIAASSGTSACRSWSLGKWCSARGAARAFRPQQYRRDEFELPQPPPAFNQLPGGQQFRVDMSEIDAGRAARGRDAPRRPGLEPGTRVRLCAAQVPAAKWLAKQPVRENAWRRPWLGSWLPQRGTHRPVALAICIPPKTRSPPPMHCGCLSSLLIVVLASLASHGRAAETDSTAETRPAVERLAGRQQTRVFPRRDAFGRWADRRRSSRRRGTWESRAGSTWSIPATKAGLGLRRA